MAPVSSCAQELLDDIIILDCLAAAAAGAAMLAMATRIALLKRGWVA
jgi:hypothetical protein